MIPKHLPLAEAIETLAVDSRSIGLFHDDGVTIELYMPIGVDPQTPHDRDEIYIIAAGSGTFSCAEDTIAFGPGDLLHVPAHTPHRFERFDIGFPAWVVFFGPVKAASRSIELAETA